MKTDKKESYATLIAKISEEHLDASKSDRKRLEEMRSWINNHKDLVKEILERCRTYWTPKGLVAFPYSNSVKTKALVDKLKLGDEITTNLDGFEITLHHK